jgi:hypothetical protein
VENHRALLQPRNLLHVPEWVGAIRRAAGAHAPTWHALKRHRLAGHRIFLPKNAARRQSDAERRSRDAWFVARHFGMSRTVRGVCSGACRAGWADPPSPIQRSHGCRFRSMSRPRALRVFRAVRRR